MLHAEPIALLSDKFPGEPLGPNEVGSLDTDAIIRFVRYRWRLCLMWMFGGLCAAIAFAMLSPAYYTAYATILLEDPLSRPLPTSVSGADAAAAAYIDSQVLVLQSDEVVARAVDQRRLTEDEEFGQQASGILAFIASSLGAGRAKIDALPRHATNLRVRHALSVSRVGMSDAVEVSVTSRDPLRSAVIANAIVQSYIDGRVELQRKAREDAATHLRERLAEVRRKAFATEPPQDLLETTVSAEEAEARSRQLQSDAENFGALYDSLLRRAYTEPDSELSSGLRVITPAAPPLRRSWPSAILVLAIVAGGGVVGIGHALLREATDHVLRSVDDARRSTGLDRIAAIPKIEGRAWKKEGSHPEGLQPSYVLTSAELCAVMGKLAVRLLEPLRNVVQSGEAAVIRIGVPCIRGGGCSMWTAEHLEEKNRRRALIIGVVAPNSGAGASAVAAHLARALAKSGQKILLVDANWRKPSSGQPMLNSSPIGKLGRQHATLQLGPESIEILVLRARDTISELTASLSITATLQLLQVGYDYVVVDFPSAQETADLEACVTVINEVIVVVEAGRTTSVSLRDYLRMIPRNKIAGLVLNQI
jgi:Mrp family chromosome partitioning ATPase